MVSVSGKEEMETKDGRHRSSLNRILCPMLFQSQGNHAPSFCKRVLSEWTKWQIDASKPLNHWTTHGLSYKYQQLLEIACTVQYDNAITFRSISVLSISTGGDGWDRWVGGQLGNHKAFRLSSVSMPWVHILCQCVSLCTTRNTAPVWKARMTEKVGVDIITSALRLCV